MEERKGAGMKEKKTLDLGRSGDVVRKLVKLLRMMYQQRNHPTHYISSNVQQKARKADIAIAQPAH